MLYSVFPLAVIATFFILLGIVYRGRTRINEVFAEYRRPAALRRLVGLWFGVIFGVFVVVQSLRIPFFEYVIGKLAHPSQVFSSWHDLAHTVGLVVLITAELTIIWQWSHYMTQCWRGITKYKIPPLPPMPNPAPSVVVLVPSCDEDPEILERSLSSVSHLRYPNLSVWLVENSRRPEFKEQAVKLAQKHGVGVLHVRNRGNKGRALNDAMKMINPAPEYLAILDADQRVQPEFLEKTVPILHGDPKLAFVQTAQEYENSNATLVCRAAAQQEMLHYDTILEGKGAVGMAMCCGTNFVMRWSALADVGGWDEESICEDMATSFDLHWKGWRSAYVRRIYSIGVGPLTLYAYWKQHWRWATGGTTILKRVIRGILTRKPIPVPYKVAVEYLWSSGFYTMTLALALLATLPILLLLFVRFGTGQGLVGPVELRPLEWVYLSVYPFYVAVMLFPFIHMKLRGYSLRNLLLVQGILANTVPVYLNAITKVMLGRKSHFEITPKSARVPRIRVWRKPQPYILLGLLTAGSVLLPGVVRGAISPVSWIVLFWLFLYSVAFGHFLIYTVFNHGWPAGNQSGKPGSPPRKQHGNLPSTVRSEDVEEAQVRS